jgi:hypothetical protein
MMPVSAWTALCGCLARAGVAAPRWLGVLALVFPLVATGQTAPGGPSLPAAIRPIMPPGSPPMPSKAASVGKTEKASTEAGVPKVLQDRLQALQITAILDDMAVMRAGALAGPPSLSAEGPPPSGGGSGGGAAVLTVRNGKPFIWIGEHLLWPVVEARSVALYWSDAASADPPLPTQMPEGARLAFYAEIGVMPIAQTARRTAEPPGVSAQVLKTKLDAVHRPHAQERAE